MCAQANGLGEIARRRTAATSAIADSKADKRLIVAGPGCGKSFTFSQALSSAIAAGGEGTKGLALTFIRNLVADLHKELGTIAEVFTFHGFCKHQMHRHAVEGLQEGWDYYPPLLDLVADDFRLLGHGDITKNAVERCLHNLDDSGNVITQTLALGNYYNAVSHTDLVYRVLRHFEHHEGEIPKYPLIVVDEYQDFSLLETRFIAVLATKSPVLIAGDDDQALYAFKNASARYIRELAVNGEYENFELPYCSRCTAVIVDAVSDVIQAATANGNLADRLAKPFTCYLPDKLADSKAHPKIIHAMCSVERKNAPYVGRYVAEQIARIPVEDIRESRQNGYPTALVIGPNPFLGSAYMVLSGRFPHAEMKTAPKTEIDRLDGYCRLALNENSRLGWRIIIHCSPFGGSDALVARTLGERSELRSNLEQKYQETHLRIARFVRRLLDNELDGDGERELPDELGRPLDQIRETLNIQKEDNEDTVDTHDVAEELPTILCTSLVGAKGLSAAHVFIVGFNDGHFPRNPEAITDEEVCCLLVALSRTRKACHVVSCGRLGAEALKQSTFATWIEKHLEERRIDAAYFKA